MVSRKPQFDDPRQLRTMHDVHLLKMPEGASLVDWTRVLSERLCEIRNRTSELVWTVPEDRGTSHQTTIYLLVDRDDNPDIRATQFLHITGVRMWPEVLFELREVPVSSPKWDDTGWLERKEGDGLITDVERWMRLAEDRALGRVQE